MAGVLGAGAACPFFSSEKSCVITSKKLLSGLPGYTEQKTKRRREKEKEKKKGEKEGYRQERRKGERVEKKMRW